MNRAESIDLGSVPVRAQHIASVEVDGEEVLYHETVGTVHVLSPSATLIWRCLDGVSTLDAVSRDLAEVFGVEQAVIGEDVVTTVRELGRQGLLEGVEPDEESLEAVALPPSPDVEAPHVE
jgi:hypothetical protein